VLVQITDIFLYQRIQFYSNSATNLHHLTSHTTPCCPITEIVVWSQITVTSLRRMYITVTCRNIQRSRS